MGVQAVPHSLGSYKNTVPMSWMMKLTTSTTIMTPGIKKPIWFTLKLLLESGILTVEILMVATILMTQLLMTTFKLFFNGSKSSLNIKVMICMSQENLMPVYMFPTLLLRWTNTMQLPNAATLPSTFKGSW